MRIKILHPGGKKNLGPGKCIKSNVRIKIGPPRRQRPDEDKNWRNFGKNVRIKIADFGHFQIRHLSVLSGVLVADVGGQQRAASRLVRRVPGRHAVTARVPTVFSSVRNYTSHSCRLAHVSNEIRKVTLVYHTFGSVYHKVWMSNRTIGNAQSKNVAIGDNVGGAPIRISTSK